MSSFLTDSTNSLVSGGQLGDQFGDVLFGPFGSGILGWFWTIVRTLSWHRSIYGLLITADESTAKEAKKSATTLLSLILKISSSIFIIESDQ